MAAENYRILANEIRNGNEDAFRRIFLQSFGRLKYLILQYVRDEEIARDLVQDAFLRLWEIRERIDVNNNIEALLFTILRNSALNYLKHKAVREKYLEAKSTEFYEDVFNYYALCDQTAEEFYAAEIQGVVTKVLENLPAKTREIFSLSRDKGLPYRKIAMELGIPEKTVENHVSSALKALRNALKDFTG